MTSHESYVFLFESSTIDKPRRTLSRIETLRQLMLNEFRFKLDDCMTNNMDVASWSTIFNPPHTPHQFDSVRSCAQAVLRVSTRLFSQTFAKSFLAVPEITVARTGPRPCPRSAQVDLPISMRRPARRSDILTCGTVAIL